MDIDSKVKQVYGPAKQGAFSRKVAACRQAGVRSSLAVAVKKSIRTAKPI